MLLLFKLFILFLKNLFLISCNSVFFFVDLLLFLFFFSSLLFLFAVLTSVCNISFLSGVVLTLLFLSLFIGFSLIFLFLSLSILSSLSSPCFSSSILLIEYLNVVGLFKFSEENKKDFFPIGFLRVGITSL